MAASSATSFLRSLQSDEDFSNVTTLTTSSPPPQGEFDTGTFVGVICFIVFLIASACIWCWCFGGKAHMANWITGQGAVDSDQQFQMTLRQRHEARMAARRSTPGKRSARLKRSFVRNKVQMTIREGDIVHGADDLDKTSDSSHSCSSDESEQQQQDTNTTVESPPDIETGVAMEDTGATPTVFDKNNDSSDDDTAVTEQENNETTDADEENSSGDDEEEEVASSPAETTNESKVEPMEPEPVESSPAATTSSNGTSLEAMEEGQSPSKDDDAVTEAIITACETRENQNLNHNEEEEAATGILCSMADLGSMTSEHPTGLLVLRPGNAKLPPKNPRMVSNCCAVCLGDYEVDDTVVWSCNKECKHAFHEECILEWLLKVADGGTPCPCCRQEFTDWETDRQERKIKWAAGSTFDINTVRLT